MKKINLPLDDKTIKGLQAGEEVRLTGTIYTARDQAHKRLVETLESGKELPFEIEGSVIYYVGPAPNKPGKAIGSAGPTTSYRMDPFVEPLLQAGLKGMIGKGARSEAVRDAIKRYKAVYFAAVGGAAALIAEHIKEAEIIAYPELGPEAVRKLYVEDLPLFVVNDIEGNDLYEQGQKKFSNNNN
ncbi:MAG: Fe-S-containing hydro-lyase [Halarsenatibacteraceae bacterium]